MCLKFANVGSQFANFKKKSRRQFDRPYFENCLKFPLVDTLQDALEQHKEVGCTQFEVFLWLLQGI